MKLSSLVEIFEKTFRQAQGEQDLKERLKNLLLGLLTPTEIEEFAQRIEIVKLLKQGIGQHAIAKKLNIGVATVSRGAKEIKEGRFKYV